MENYQFVLGILIIIAISAVERKLLEIWHPSVFNRGILLYKKHCNLPEGFKWPLNKAIIKRKFSANRIKFIDFKIEQNAILLRQKTKSPSTTMHGRIDLNNDSKNIT